MISVKWTNGVVTEYDSKDSAAEDILEAFAASGQDLVDVVWTGADGEEEDLVLCWSLTIENA